MHALWSFGILAGTVIAGTLIDIDPGMPLAIGALANLVSLTVAAMLFHGRRVTALESE